MEARPFPELAPYGVIDIGSNSVRLVIYDGISRSPDQIFNERIFCALGAKLKETGVLNPQGIDNALKALGRFGVIAQQFQVRTLDVVATAAVRDATPESRDGFVARVEALLGAPVQVLSGQQEALCAAEGVIYGMPRVSGLVGDLGGGSLELARVIDGQIHETVSLPLGVLWLPGQTFDDMDAIHNHVTDDLKCLDWLGSMAGLPVLAVGGNWRNFARAHMHYTKAPLRMLHAYTISREDMDTFLALLLAGDGDAHKATGKLKKRRQKFLAQAAASLNAVVAAAGASHVTISGHGLREGLLFRRMDEEQRALDPLFESAHRLALRLGRMPPKAAELDAWLAPLFDGDRAPALRTGTMTPGSDASGCQGSVGMDHERLRRLRHGAAILSDVGWQFHQDQRGRDTGRLLMLSPFPGIDHPERAFLALTMWHRYTTSEPIESPTANVLTLLDGTCAAQAKVLGIGLRLAYDLTGGALDLLSCSRLEIEEDTLVLNLRPPCAALPNENVEIRMDALATALGLARSRIQS